ncbi:MAG: rhomboid family intramembrane serine protease [Planctomycetes bacterium]|nr:rhomboid family intramembrane serine protease [Planctomycetota bacterium]
MIDTETAGGILTKCNSASCGEIYQIPPGKAGALAGCPKCGKRFNNVKLSAENAGATEKLKSRPALPVSFAVVDVVKAATALEKTFLLSSVASRIRKIGNGSVTVDVDQVSFAPDPENASKNVNIPIERISNVFCEHDRVSFTYLHSGRSTDIYIFGMEDRKHAIALLELLPNRKSQNAVRFQQKGAILDAFALATPRLLATPALAAVNAFYLILLIVFSLQGRIVDASQLLRFGANQFSFTTSGEWWRLGSSAFLHTGYLHLLIDTCMLMLVAPLAERLMGTWFFLLIYIHGIVVSGLTGIYFDRQSFIVGASGANFAILGAVFAILLSKRKSLPSGIFSETLVYIIVYPLYAIRFLDSLHNQGISAWTCVSGIVSGFVMGLVIARPMAPLERTRQAFSRGLAGSAVAIISILIAVSMVPRGSLDGNLLDQFPNNVIRIYSDRREFQIAHDKNFTGTEALDAVTRMGVSSTINSSQFYPISYYSLRQLALLRDDKGTIIIIVDDVKTKVSDWYKDIMDRCIRSAAPALGGLPIRVKVLDPAYFQKDSFIVE